MELALTFGAVGDFLSIALLIKDIVSALDESRGSAKAYRGLVHEITHLQKALEQVDHIYRRPDLPSGLRDLISIVQTTISQVCDSLRTFHGRIGKRYGDSLAEGGSGNIFRDAAKKIQWKLEEKDVDKFRAELAGHRMTLELFLQVTTVRLEQENHKALTTQLSETERSTTAIVRRYGYSIESRLGFLGRRILSKLDFVARLGINMTKSASQILTLMFAVSGDLSIIRSVVLRLDRGVNNGEHFVLEDATGRSFPIHMKTITSWEAFNFILEDQFKGKKGERRTRRKLYSLHESSSNLEIDRSAHFESAFMPYQKVDMSLICKAPMAPTTSDGETGLSSCPWCKTVSPGKLGDRVQCSTCKRDFLRVVVEVEDSDDLVMAPSPTALQRIADVQFGKPSLGTSGKRAREDDDCEPCNKCQRAKRPKAALGEERKCKRPREPDSDSESDEENLAGLAHVTLQTKRMRLLELETRPFQAVQADSFDYLARKVLGDDSPMFATVSTDSPYNITTSRFVGEAGKPRVEEVLSDEESDVEENLPDGDGNMETSGVDGVTYETYFVERKLRGPEANPNLERWAQIRKNAAERAAERAAAKPAAERASLPREDDDASDEETIESRVVRIKARVAELLASVEGSQKRTSERHHDTAGLHSSQDTDTGIVAELASLGTPTSAVVPKSTTLERPHAARYQPRKATELDRKKHGIPAGYSLKRWDPEEDPIFLLGSVFDANSLGKWIYDWAVYHYGPLAPTSEMAGDLWLLLIKLVGKTKKAEETLPGIKSKDKREMVEDFVEAGDRLQGNLRKLIKVCTTSLLELAGGKDTRLGKSAGTDFVGIMFGEDKQLQKTERFMASVKLWNLRFDTVCEEILRKPAM